VAHIQSYKELRVYQTAIEAAMRIFALTKSFPVEERYSLTDQIRRASRSVCSNIGEAWRKQRYRAHFVSKLSDSEGEAEETRIWLEFSYRCGYMSEAAASELDHQYDHIIAQLVRMIDKPEQWSISKK
jgi:four helix bundle protein